MRTLLWLAVLGCSSSPLSPLSQARRVRGKAIGAYKADQWSECAKLFASIDDHYGAASCRARAGDREQAIADLERALASPAQLRYVVDLEDDPDLAALHDDARWPQLAERSRAAKVTYESHLNRELRALYEADQADRAGGRDHIDWTATMRNDAEREKRVDAILAAGGAKVADDYFHAAMIYQHEEGKARRAHELAKKAVELDPAFDAARWLAAAALDRDLMQHGMPQKYGTQFQERGGKWVLWEVDPTVTDDERAEWNCPPLAMAKARAEAMNQK